MNEDVIADLKQFIATTISQQTAELSQRIDTMSGRMDGISEQMATKDDLAELEHRLNKKIDDTGEEILSAIGDTLSTKIAPITLPAMQSQLV